MYVQRNIDARSCNHRCSEKAMSISYSKCVSGALGIQHSKRMRHITLSSVAGPTAKYFSTLYHKGTIFGGGGGEAAKRKICVLTYFATFI
jgi:hypothetical protein